MTTAHAHRAVQAFETMAVLDFAAPFVPERGRKSFLRIIILGERAPDRSQYRMRAARKIVRHGIAAISNCIYSVTLFLAHIYSSTNRVRREQSRKRDKTFQQIEEAMLTDDGKADPNSLIFRWKRTATPFPVIEIKNQY